MPNDSDIEALNEQKQQLEKQLEEKNGRVLALEYFVYKAIGKLHKYKIKENFQQKVQKKVEP